MPPSKVIAQSPTDDPYANLEKLMRASRIPTHLLILGHSFVHELIDRRLNKSA